ncbi:MAG: histidinol dehydrogenase [Sphingomonadaceae bacterium]
MQQLATSDPDFARRFAALVADTREGAADVSADVAAILARVRREGFAAMADLTMRFDRFALTPANAEVSAAEREAAAAAVPQTTRKALATAAARIRAFHEAQKPADLEMTDAHGVRMGFRHTPVARAGLYVPGGRAAYPSSVLMNAIPASVAGVAELIMVTPTPDGVLDPLVMLAAELAGVARVFRIGGAQAVAALAHGIAPVPRADVIVGPGNAWVAEAKRQLYGTVGIDMVAGPSEVLVLADATARPDWVAADLLSQAEHDPAAQAILMTDSPTLAGAVVAAVERLLPTLATEAVARASWERHGVVILLRSLDEAPALVDALAPEHLELMVAEPQPLFAAIRNAGSIFIGEMTPEAIGDYVGGPNHVLPTGRRARFASGLSVRDFMKRTTFLEAGAGFPALAGAAAELADAEGLAAHALSVRIRG